MDKYTKKLLLIATLFSTAFGFSDSYSKNKGTYNDKYKGEQTYTSGPYVSIGTNLGCLSGGYYFGPNNIAAGFISVTPFQQSFVSYPANQDNSWSTGIAAGAGLYLPLGRKTLQNKLFILDEFLWTQSFGQALSALGKINSSWSTTWIIGLQYRLTSSIYLSFRGPLISFFRTNYRDATPSAFFPTTQSLWSWSILSQGTAAIEYKF